MYSLEATGAIRKAGGGAAEEQIVSLISAMFGYIIDVLWHVVLFDLCRSSCYANPVDTKKKNDHSLKARARSRSSGSLSIPTNTITQGSMDTWRAD